MENLTPYPYQMAQPAMTYCPPPPPMPYPSGPRVQPIVAVNDKSGAVIRLDGRDINLDSGETIEYAIAQLKVSSGKVDGFDARITAVEDEIKGVANWEDRISTVENKMTVVQGHMATLQTDMTDLKGQMTTLEAKVDGITEDITTTIDARIDLKLADLDIELVFDTI